MKLLAKGRVLTDSERTLHSYGLTAGAKVVVMAGPADACAGAPSGAATVADATGRLLAAAEKVCSRTTRDGLHRYQAGSGLTLSDGDRKGLGLGMVLHEQAKHGIEQGDLQGALRLLELSEQAFELVHMDAVGAIDNVALMLVDLVWCCFKLQDRDKLAISGARLERARRDLERAHGADLSRLRCLQGGFCPEVATYLRLYLLRGVCCYYNNDAAAALPLLIHAQGLLSKLQVSEQALVALMNMGFDSKLSTRALRFCGNDVANAVDFCFSQQQAAADAEARTEASAATRRLQRRLGRTAGGKWIDMEALEQLEGLGYARALACEALKQSENDLHRALDMVSNELTRHVLEAAIATAPPRAPPRPPRAAAEDAPQAGSSVPRAQTDAGSPAADPGPGAVDQAAVDVLMQEGFRKYYARWALSKCQGNLDNARAALRAWGTKTLFRAPAAAAAEMDEREDAQDGDDAEDAPDWEAEKLVVDRIASAAQDPLAAYDLDTTEEAAALQQFLCQVQEQLCETNSTGVA